MVGLGALRESALLTPFGIRLPFSESRWNCKSEHPRINGKATTNPPLQDVRRRNHAEGYHPERLPWSVPRYEVSSSMQSCTMQPIVETVLHSTTVIFGIFFGVGAFVLGLVRSKKPKFAIATVWPSVYVTLSYQLRFHYSGLQHNLLGRDLCKLP